MSQIKVFLVDDDPEWLSAMEIFLGNYSDITVVGVAATKDEAINMAQAMDIDVILMDINLNETRYDGIYAAAEICRLKEVKILMLTSLNEKDIILNSFIAGAVNYIPKSHYQEIPEAIRKTYYNCSPVEIALRDYSRLKEAEQLQSLSKSEREIFELAEQGYSQTEISENLHKSIQTVKNQISVILKKLGAGRLKDAITKVKTKGIIEPK